MDFVCFSPLSSSDYGRLLRDFFIDSVRIETLIMVGNPTLASVENSLLLQNRS